MRWERQNRSRPDTGATGTEYAALVLVSIAVIVGVLATLTPGLLAPRTEDAVCTAFQDEGCEAPPPSGQSGSPGDTPGTGGPAGPPDDRQGSPWDPRSWGPHWNDAFTGMTPASALLQGFGRQVGDFFGGVGTFFKDAGQGIIGGIWSDLVGIKDLVVHPIDSAQGVWWAITNPTESLPMLVWDDESRQDWGDGKKVRAVGRGVWNVGSWFIPFYDIGKAVSKVGKFGTIASKAGKLGTVGRLAEEAAEAAARARKAAQSGDVPAARKAADEARRKADEAEREAKRAGCRVVGLGPPPRAPSYGRMAVAPAVLAPLRADPGCDDAAKARKEAEAAARQLRAAERAQKVKDIDGALQAKRYEDADNFSDDLETMAKDAEARAAKDPTPENKKEAQDARDAAEKARNKIIDQKIAERAVSPDERVSLPAKTARALRSVVRNFEKQYGPNGTKGEIDIETGKAIIEVAAGTRARGKVAQHGRNANNPVTNPHGKPIIIYAPNMKRGAVQNLRNKTGAKVIDNLDDLKAALRELGEPVP